MLLPGTTSDGAALAAERFRKVIGQAAVRLDSGQRLAVTVSAGVACASDQDGTTADDLFSLADQAMYKAKMQGRNRVVVGTVSDRFPKKPADGFADVGVACNEKELGGIA